MGRWILGRSGTGWGTRGDVQDGLGDLGEVRETLEEIWDGSGDPPKSPGRVGGPSERSGTGRGTHP